MLFLQYEKISKKLEEFYENNPDFLQPESRKNELFNNFIKPGIEDLCVSRTNFDWGIKVPSDPKHVIYVWLDALTNYITAIGYMSDNESKFEKLWPADIQIVGKDIIRFHGIYWPIFLMSLGLPIPKKLYAHGFISIKNGKMSKSKGNVIYPEQLTERYGLDATKYYLLREFPFDQDIIFTPESFINRYNGDLANDLGNLLNRTIGMINKYFNGKIDTSNISKTEKDEEIEKEVLNIVTEVEKYLDDIHFSNALEKIWEIVSLSNKYIDDSKPWELFKSEDEDDKNKLISVMAHLVENLKIVATLINPVMQETSASILKQLKIDGAKWDDIKNYEIAKNIEVIETPEVLFARLDSEEETAYLAELIREKN